LEEAMDAINSGTTSFKHASRHQNIPLTFFSNHLSGKTRSRKCGSGGVLIEKEDEVVVAWTLVM
jgi:hypothetical protein